MAALVLALMAACGSTSSVTDDGRPLVLTTFTVLADVAAEVAGEDLRVASITKAGAEIHGYEPTPGDIRSASDAALILDNGLGLEQWFSRFVAEAEVPHVVVSDGINPIDITGDVDEGKPNPHAWMSPVVMQSYVDAMVEAFSELDPAHAEHFEARGAAYNARLQELHDDLIANLAMLPRQHRTLVTCEGAFSYLARDAGLSERYLWPVNAEAEATPQRIASVIAYVRSNGVPAVFCESTVSDRAMQQVVAATGAEFGGTLYVDSLSEPDGPVPTYLELIRYDTDLIVSALSAGPS